MNRSEAVEYARGCHNNANGVLRGKLRKDRALRERMQRDLERAVENIDEILQKLKIIDVDSRTTTMFGELKTRINKYILTESDCSWQQYDRTISQTIDNLSLCYQQLMNKIKYTVGDFIYAYTTLSNTRDEFVRMITKLQMADETVETVASASDK